ncbi:MAG: hypothetical protein SF028_14000 [Candidatus Sumerlaeia bacterium]|nr:hypothetical protein [Candidatus Sumerlaeia bacterium]
MLTCALLLAVAGARDAAGASTDISCYADAPHGSRFYDAAQLPDGSFLVAGKSPDLDWIDAATPRTPLTLPAGVVDNNTGTGMVGFILHLSADLQSIQRVAHFADGAVEDVGRLRFTSAPGEPPGALYISGRNSSNLYRADGYWVARLDGNFTDAVPTGAEWAYVVWAEGDHKSVMPWDVGGDGKVVYVTGQPHSTGWAAAYRLTATGAEDTVPNWRTHWATLSGGGTTEFYGLAADSPNPVQRSGYVLKPRSRGCLRSWTQAEYDAWTPDGNGGVRKGTYPCDVFYTAPFDPAAPSSNQALGGYTGYRLPDSGSTTARCVGVAVDRRTNAFYLGFSFKSVLPGGNPDFEPAVVAFDADGSQRWWQRLYREWNGDPATGSPLNSTPDQYVDALAIDYSEPEGDGDLVVLARCHGNNVSNFWNGNQVSTAANPGNPGYSFHHQFTGTSGNIHISWLGRFRQSDGALQYASWNAEYAEGAALGGGLYTDPNLDGWPSHQSGWPDLNTTRMAPGVLGTDAEGKVYVLARSARRSITTANAFQKMPKPAEGFSAWNAYVRVYAHQMTTLAYSSLLTGAWDTATQSGADNTTLEGVLPVANGVLVVGWHQATGTPAVAEGVPMPTRNVLPWGAAAPAGEVPLIARLSFSEGPPAGVEDWMAR